MELDSLKVKIQKLLAKAESAKTIGNIQEASLFAEKVNELLLKHNLEMAEISVANDENDITEDREAVEASSGLGKWSMRLLDVLCKYNFCTAIYHDRGVKKMEVTIIGSKENIGAVSYLYDVLKSQFEKMAKNEYSTYIDGIRANFLIKEQDIKVKLATTRLKMDDLKKVKDGYVYKKPTKFIKGCANRSKYYKSFLLGAVRGVYLKLEESNVKMKANSDDVSKKLTSLVLSNQSKLKDYVNQRFSNLKESSNRATKILGDAYRNGEAAGKNAQFAKGAVNGDSCTTKMLN